MNEWANSFRQWLRRLLVAVVRKYSLPTLVADRVELRVIHHHILESLDPFDSHCTGPTLALAHSVQENTRRQRMLCARLPLDTE
jgi:hypothetical protein